MNVGQLIESLGHFDKSLEVVIADGYDLLFYRGEFELSEFIEDDGSKVLDIGIGGLRFGEEMPGGLVEDIEEEQ